MILQVHIQKKYYQEAGECETVLIDSAKYRKLIAMRIY